MEWLDLLHALAAVIGLGANLARRREEIRARSESPSREFGSKHRHFYVYDSQTLKIEGNNQLF